MPSCWGFWPWLPEAIETIFFLKSIPLLFTFVIYSLTFTWLSIASYYLWLRNLYCILSLTRPCGTGAMTPAFAQTLTFALGFLLRPQWLIHLISSQVGGCENWPSTQGSLGRAVSSLINIGQATSSSKEKSTVSKRLVSSRRAVRKPAEPLAYEKPSNRHIKGLNRPVNCTIFLTCPQGVWEEGRYFWAKPNWSWRQVHYVGSAGQGRAPVLCGSPLHSQGPAHI